MLCRDDGHVVGLLISGVLALAPVAAGVIVARRTRHWGRHPSVRTAGAVVAGVSLALLVYYAASTAIFGPVFCPF